jgi:hypothetical protein
MRQSKSTQRMMERRASARTDANLSMRLMGERAETLPEFVTETENVSSSGVYCYSPHYLAPLSKVGLTLVLPDRVADDPTDRLLKCEAVVVRCQQNPAPAAGRRYELACSFLDLDDDHRQLLDEFVTLRNLKALRTPSAATARRTRTRAVSAARAKARPVVRARAKAAKKKTVRAARTKRTARSSAATASGGRSRTRGRSRAR